MVSYPSFITTEQQKRSWEQVPEGNKQAIIQQYQEGGTGQRAVEASFGSYSYGASLPTGQESEQFKRIQELKRGEMYSQRYIEPVVYKTLKSGEIKEIPISQLSQSGDILTTKVTATSEQVYGAPTGTKQITYYSPEYTQTESQLIPYGVKTTTRTAGGELIGVDYQGRAVTQTPEGYSIDVSPRQYSLEERAMALPATRINTQTGYEEIYSQQEGRYIPSQSQLNKEAYQQAYQEEVQRKLGFGGIPRPSETEIRDIRAEQLKLGFGGLSQMSLERNQIETQLDAFDRIAKTIQEEVDKLNPLTSTQKDYDRVNNMIDGYSKAVAKYQGTQEGSVYAQLELNKRIKQIEQEKELARFKEEQAKTELSRGFIRATRPAVETALSFSPIGEQIEPGVKLLTEKLPTYAEEQYRGLYELGAGATKPVIEYFKSPITEKVKVAQKAEKGAIELIGGTQEKLVEAMGGFDPNKFIQELREAKRVDTLKYVQELEKRAKMTPQEKVKLLKEYQKTAEEFTLLTGLAALETGAGLAVGKAYQAIKPTLKLKKLEYTAKGKVALEETLKPTKEGLKRLKEDLFPTRIKAGELDDLLGLSKKIKQKYTPSLDLISAKAGAAIEEWRLGLKEPFVLTPKAATVRRFGKETIEEISKRAVPIKKFIEKVPKKELIPREFREVSGAAEDVLRQLEKRQLKPLLSNLPNEDSLKILLKESEKALTASKLNLYPLYEPKGTYFDIGNVRKYIGEFEGKTIGFTLKKPKEIKVIKEVAEEALDLGFKTVKPFYETPVKPWYEIPVKPFYETPVKPWYETKVSKEISRIAPKPTKEITELITKPKPSSKIFLSEDVWFKILKPRQLKTLVAPTDIKPLVSIGKQIAITKPKTQITTTKTVELQIKKPIQIESVIAPTRAKTTTKTTQIQIQKPIQIESVIQPTKTKTTTKTAQIQIQKPVQLEELATKTEPISKVSTKSAEIQIQAPVQLEELASATRLADLTRLIQPSATRLADLTSLAQPQATAQALAQPMPPIEEIITRPTTRTIPIFLPEEERKTKKKGVIGYIPEIKSKGKFSEPSGYKGKALSLSGALALGADVTNNTPAATFRIKQRTARELSPIGYSAPSFDFIRNKFYTKGKNFIEKNEYRIDTEGEFKGITVKGYLANKRKAKINLSLKPMGLKLNKGKIKKIKTKNIKFKGFKYK